MTRTAARKLRKLGKQYVCIMLYIAYFVPYFNTFDISIIVSYSSGPNGIIVSHMCKTGIK